MYIYPHTYVHRYVTYIHALYTYITQCNIHARSRVVT